MKKVLAIVLAALLIVAALAGCAAKSKTADTTATTDTAAAETTDGKLEVLKVGASSTPHAEILEQVKDTLAAEGYDLQIVVYDDYVLPNQSLADGSLDANYFQHTPYLNSFNAANGTDLVSAAKIHYEPFGRSPRLRRPGHRRRLRRRGPDLRQHRCLPRRRGEQRQDPGPGQGPAVRRCEDLHREHLQRCCRCDLLRNFQITERAPGPLSGGAFCICVNPYRSRSRSPRSRRSRGCRCQGRSGPPARPAPAARSRRSRSRRGVRRA